MRIFLIYILFLLIPASLLAQEINQSANLDGLPITEIRIKTRRIKPELVRKAIPVKEGDMFLNDQIEKIRLRLYQMRFFKKLDVKADKDPEREGVIISLDLSDGWFLFPLPFYSGGGGGSNGSLMLVERNIFRNAETVYLFGSGNRDGAFGLIGFQLEQFNMSVNVAQKSFKEWNYFDGGVNASGRFRSSAEEEYPEKYGVVVNQYERKIESGGLNCQMRLNNSFRAQLGLIAKNFYYENSTVNILPPNKGRLNSVAGGWTIHFGDASGSGAGYGSFFQDFGAVFGFGMADINERIQPLQQVRKHFGIEMNFQESDKIIGSDFNSTIFSLGTEMSLTFRNRQKIMFRAKGASGSRVNLPFGQKIATNRELGMRGNYAREFRGDRGAASALIFMAPFRRTARGVWTTEFFSDFGLVWDSGKSLYKEGVGFGLTYQFWRFPLPFGFLYSYSIDDREFQFNFAVGGRF